LRARLVAATLLLLGLASAVIAVVTAVVLRAYLLRELDDGLRVFARVLIRDDPGPDPRRVLLDTGGPPRPPDSLMAVVDPSGTVLAAETFPRTGGLSPVPESEYADLVGIVPDGAPVSVDLGPLGPYRLGRSRPPSANW
jgi:hypothetical protein